MKGKWERKRKWQPPRKEVEHVTSSVSKSFSAFSSSFSLSYDKFSVSVSGSALSRAFFKKKLVAAILPTRFVINFFLRFLLSWSQPFLVFVLRQYLPSLLGHSIYLFTIRSLPFLLVQHACLSLKSFFLIICLRLLLFFSLPTFSSSHREIRRHFHSFPLFSICLLPKIFTFKGIWTLRKGFAERLLYGSMEIPGRYSLSKACAFHNLNDISRLIWPIMKIVAIYFYC